MSKVALSLETIGSLDCGAAGVVINNEIAAAIADIEDRGNDGQKREVMIQLTLKREENSVISASVKSQAKMPPRRTHKTFTENAKNNNDQTELLFQEMAPDDPHQETIPMPNDGRASRKAAK